VSEFVDALVADGPHPDLAAELQTFGQFVGSWDLLVTFYDADGTTREVPGEWHFAWVLAGRAVQDVWIAPSRAYEPRDGDPEQEWGASLRFYDPALGAWQSTWVGPVRTVVRAFTAREAGDEIVLSGSFEPGTLTRWAFSEITPTTFRWRNEESRDDGASWRLLQTFAATRGVSASRKSSR